MPKHPESDYGAPDPQMTIYEEAQQQALPEPLTPPAEPLVFVVPESVRPAVERIQAEDDSAFDRVDAQGQTTNLGTRERAGIETNEDGDRKAAEAARRRLAKNPRRKPQKSRRGLQGQSLSNADGPPPHVPDSRKTY